MTKGKFMSKLENNLNFEKSILIVEDESILAIGMEYSLESFGYSVSGIETSYETAVLHAKEYHPDLIIMDIKLKGEKTGIDAAKVIWQEYKIPIIFLTSYSSEKMIEKAVQTEPYGYLLKPYREKELKATIKTTLYKHNYFYKNKETITKQDTLSIGTHLTFNRYKGILQKDGETIILTKNEIKLFEVLTENINESVSFAKICDYIWREPYFEIATLRALVYRIKKKLKMDIIENIYEYGYLLKDK